MPAESETSATGEQPARKRRKTDRHLPVADWLNDRKYSDLTIKCCGEEFFAHRVVLAPQCEFFEKCCDDNSEEAASRVVRMDDDNPAALGHMLRYMYSGGIEHLLTSASDCILTNHVREVAVADLITTRFDLVETLLDVFLLADKYGLPKLSEIIVRKMAELEPPWFDGSKGDKFTKHSTQLAEAAQLIRAYIRVVSLPVSVYALTDLLNTITYLLTDLKCPYHRLWLEPKECFGEKSRTPRNRNEEFINLTVNAIAENPQAALYMISMLGNKVSTLTQAFYDREQRMPRGSPPHLDSEADGSEPDCEPGFGSSNECDPVEESDGSDRMSDLDSRMSDLDSEASYVDPNTGANADGGDDAEEEDDVDDGHDASEVDSDDRNSSSAGSSSSSGDN